MSAFSLPAAEANHDQDGITFDHVGGNEWWVEVKLSGSKADWWGPEVRDTNGDWKPMNRPSWSSDPNHYVVSYHVEPGHKVQFRMQEPKSSHYVASCWFSHPAGVESCDGSDTFQVTFTPLGGDSESIRVKVAATQPIGRVYAEPVPSYGTVELFDQGNGTHLRYTHVPDGTVLRFWTLNSATYESAQSGCYRWPDATPVDCPTAYLTDAYNPTPIGGDWSRMEASVSAWHGTPAKVEVRFDGGGWQAMSYDGAYKATFQGAPTTGTHAVQFRAIDAQGRVACTERAYQWPYSGSSAPYYANGFAFGEPKGNADWVQMNVFSSRDVIAVEASVNQGPWQALTQMSYCDWAKGIHVPDGSGVRFRATFNNLEGRGSNSFAWPPGGEAVPFEATFTPSGGKSLIRVDIDATRPVTYAKYDVFAGHELAAGAVLAEQADGSWARTGAYEVPDGLVLRFSAWGPDPTYQPPAQACFRWTSMTPVACPEARETWVSQIRASDGGSTLEADTAWSEVPSKLQVRFDGGAFQDMAPDGVGEYDYTLKGAPTTGGHVAEFRFVYPDGGVKCTEDGYEWPTRYGSPLVGRDAPVFAEAKGTTGWVQVNVYGRAVVAVEAQVNGGAWQSLQFQSYCDWAKAMSAPTGSTVRFRAFESDLSSTLSAPMTWPPGSGGTTPPPPSGFDATFSGVKGNEWWVQASVSATGGTLSKVDVSLNGGAWKPLANKGWGWAASYHAPAGTIVQLRATSTTGATDLSGCYKWTTAAPVTCPGGTTPPPPTGSSFDATFKNVKGNEWWIQTDVSVTGGTLAGVDARVNGGAWTALTKQSWGSWAKSIHAPTGSTVELRARATDGSTDVSGAYKWPPA